MRIFTKNIFIIIISILNFFFNPNANAQVNQKSLKHHVVELSSEKYEGRSLNSKGIRYAERYILNKINTFNLLPINSSFRQEFSIIKHRSSIPPEPNLIFKRNKLIYKEDFYTIGTNSTETCKYPILELENFTKQKVTYDCAILLKDSNDSNIIISDNIKLLLIPTYSTINYKEIINSNTNGNLSPNTTNNFIIDNSIQKYYLNPSTSKKIKSTLRKRSNIYITAPCPNSHSSTNTANLYGMISGTQGDSTIIISAHYDHIGIRNKKLNPGANDNASGVSAVLEIANTLSHKISKPKYNILFVFFSAEESGLLGSDFFLKNCPIKKETIMANINMDMIGNKDNYHEKEPNFIYAYGPENSQHLVSKIDSINNIKSYLKLDFFEHDIEMGKRFLNMSDQASFIKSNIPVLFIFNGLSPNYHKPTDTYDKLNYKKIKNVCNLTIDLITEIAY